MNARFGIGILWHEKLPDLQKIGLRTSCSTCCHPSGTPMTARSKAAVLVMVVVVVVDGAAPAGGGVRVVVVGVVVGSVE